MVKFWVCGFTLFLVLFGKALASEKRDYEFETLLIHDSSDQKVYLAFEKTGYLKNISTEAGVNSLVVVKKNGTFVVDPGPHRGYIDELFKTITSKYRIELPPVKLSLIHISEPTRP